MVFVLFNDCSERISIILVYVGDFLGVVREDCDIEPVWQAFKWGSLSKVEPDKEFTFTLSQRPSGRYFLRLCQAEFIKGFSTARP